MGIESLCLPEDLGAPFINVDWNGADIPAATGRMVSIGFEELYAEAAGVAVISFMPLTISPSDPNTRFLLRRGTSKIVEHRRIRT